MWGQHEEPLPDIDESDLLDDLQLLSVPTDVYGEDMVSMVEGPDPDQTGKNDLAALEALLAESPDDGQTLDGPSSHEGLVLDDLSDESERPVVLLDEASRKAARSPEDDDYMSELERRLADED